MPQRKPGPVVTVEVPAPLGRDGKAAWLTQNQRLHHRVKAPITKSTLSLFKVLGEYTDFPLQVQSPPGKFGKC